LRHLNDDRLPGAGCLGRSHVLFIIPATLPLDLLQRGLISGEFLADIDAAVLHFEVQEPDAEHASIDRAGASLTSFSTRLISAQTSAVQPPRLVG